MPCSHKSVLVPHSSMSIAQVDPVYPITDAQLQLYSTPCTVQTPVPWQGFGLHELAEGRNNVHYII